MDATPYIPLKTNLTEISNIFLTMSGKLKNFFKDYYEPYAQKTYDEYKRVRHRLSRTQGTVNFYDVYVEPFLEKDKTILPSNFYELFGESHNILIIGNAGCGKTTLVRHLFMQSIDIGYAIPIVITLRRFNKNPIGIKEFIKNELAEALAYPDKNTVESFLDEGKFLILLDGFDELYSENFEQVHDDLNAFCKKYSQNYFLMTSRPFTSSKAFTTSFVIYNVANFTTTQVSEFIKKNEKDSEFADKMIKTIESANANSNQRYLTEFLNNPLLLLMYIMTYRSEPRIPEKKSKFYENVINELFYSHDLHTKNDFKRQFHSGLDRDEIKKILYRFSALSFFRNRFEFDRDYIFKILEDIKNKLLAKFDNGCYVDDVVSNLSIFVEDGTVISYVHRSIQEYLAAYHISHFMSDETAKEVLYQERVFRSAEKNINFSKFLQEMDEYMWTKHIALATINEYANNILYAEKDVDVIVDYLLASVFDDFNSKSQGFAWSYLGDRSLINHIIGHDSLEKIGWYISQNVDFEELIESEFGYSSTENKEAIIKSLRKNNTYSGLKQIIIDAQASFDDLKKEIENRLLVLEQERQGDKELLSLI